MIVLEFLEELERQIVELGYVNTNTTLLMKIKDALKELEGGEELIFDNQELKIMEEEAQQYAQKIHLKHKELEAYCEEQKDTWESQENGNHKVYEKILIKLKDKQ